MGVLSPRRGWCEENPHTFGVRIGIEIDQRGVRIRVSATRNEGSGLLSRICHRLIPLILSLTLICLSLLSLLPSSVKQTMRGSSELPSSYNLLKSALSQQKHQASARVGPHSQQLPFDWGCDPLLAPDH